MTTQTLTVPDISCGHCKMSIEGALGDLAGVATAEVNIEAHTVEVTWDDAAVQLETVIGAIEEQGYDVTR